MICAQFVVCMHVRVCVSVIYSFLRNMLDSENTTSNYIWALGIYIVVEF